MAFFQSCDNELVVAADWEEVPIVYGVLNPTDQVNYIRIQRAYLDRNSGALNFAGIPDSLYFDSLVVSVTEVHNGVEKNTYQLTRIDGNTQGLLKDSGIFSNEYNYLYRLNANVNASTFSNTYEYRLTIFNPESGKITRSTTLAVGRPEVESPASVNSVGLIITNDENFKIVGIYQEGIYARSYDMVMRIWVEEINKEDTSNRRALALDWTMFQGQRTQSINGFRESIAVIPAGRFFTFMASQLDETANVNRRLLGFDLYTYGVGQDLYTYISVNEPSIGIVQKKPEYTNIDGGFGIFSSRHIDRLLNKNFDIRTRQALQENEKTANLNFVTY